MRAIAVEENNLADALRAAVAYPTPLATAELTAALAGFWTVRGENTRVIAIASAVDAALDRLGARRRTRSTPRSPPPPSPL